MQRSMKRKQSSPERSNLQTCSRGSEGELTWNYETFICMMQNRLFWWTGFFRQLPSLYMFSPKHPCPCLVIASPMNHAATFCGDLGRQALMSELWISTLSHILGDTLVANRVCVWVELKFKGTLPRSVHWNSSLVTEGANTPEVCCASRLDPCFKFHEWVCKGLGRHALMSASWFSTLFTHSCGNYCVLKKFNLHLWFQGHTAQKCPLELLACVRGCRHTWSLALVYQQVDPWWGFTGVFVEVLEGMHSCQNCKTQPSPQILGKILVFQIRSN